MNSIQTPVLEIFYEQSGPPDGPPVLLLHGWPDGPLAWKPIAEALNQQGWQTIVPSLRGSQPTRFLSPDTPRAGSGVALAQDAFDLANALNLNRFAVIGHDWGARIAYILAALAPERISAIAALSLAFQPRGVFNVPDLQQSRRFWYQWFQCTNGGAEAIRKDPIAFARIQWDTWSPPGWFDEATFAATAQSFTHPDWTAITLNAYRSRWVAGEATDPRYDPLQQKLSSVDTLSTPTLMIQGASDFCDDPKESEGLEPHFSAEYQRILLPSVGHFPHREAPGSVTTAILDFLSRHQ
jgi:pimeloyl-ACP methyl ester carboxylesterase